MVVYLNKLKFLQDNVTEPKMSKSSSFINAFKLIAMSNDLDLSGLFKEEASLYM